MQTTKHRAVYPGSLILILIMFFTASPAANGKTAELTSWKANAVYLAGEQVVYAAAIFEARWWTQGDEPDAANSDGPWLFIANCQSGQSGACDPTNPGEPVEPPSGPQPNPGGGYTMLKSELEAAEAALTSSAQFLEVKASIETRSNAEVELIQAGAVTNPENVKRVEQIFSEQQWLYTFPQRHSAYSYEKFLQAIGKFKGFCAGYSDGRSSDAICRKSLATMFAHFTQETGGHDANSPIEEWRQALVYVREAGCNENDSSCLYNAECSPDTWQGQQWPCGTRPGGGYQKYYGRGAKQLSYNYNYGPFSQAMYGDVSVLLQNPELVADSWLNIASAVFFYLYPASPKPSMLHVIDGTWQPNSHDLSLGIQPGFGATTNIINGGIECGHGHEKPQSLNRMAYYREHAAALGVPVESTEVLGCANQKSFDTDGAGAMQIYWDQDWGYYPDMPEGKSFACKLVGYQTRHFALQAGDYQKCVQHYFDVEVIDN
ncbi:glycoside hydrolase family 19 protein [Thalassomonas sp. RHCl1]|uniref:glycoside hydrolase family 19 protein n=1 Tax=Thalassomonas sp. RHCl1 TaxID=2995320 RepID=UPI00248D16CE|nr:glycoside hydrolase family 19 protein [Thalassomonas sp. RHCl1]